MATMETWFNQDIKKPVKVHYLDGNVFTLDNNGYKIGVNLFDDGSPLDAWGTITASVIRSDGATVAITGSSSGNKAWVLLPQSACVVPGSISIVIKATSGSTITTICAVASVVYMTETGTTVDPGTIIPSIESLIAEIEAAIASIPADYSDLWASIAPTFSTSKAYIPGQYATYNGAVYRFIHYHGASAWNANDVVITTLGTQIFDLNKSSGELRNIAPNQLNGNDFTGDRTLFCRKIVGYYVYTQSRYSEMLTVYNSSMTTYIVPIEPNAQYTLGACQWWVIVDDCNRTLYGCTSSGDVISSLNTASYPEAAYIWISYAPSDTVSFKKTGDFTKPVGVLEWLGVDNDNILDKTIAPNKFRGVDPNQNLIPFFAAEKVVGQGYYAYGVVGEAIHIARNNSFMLMSYYVFDLEPNTTYYFSETQWWGAINAFGICIAGGGSSGTNPASQFNTASYPEAVRIYVSTEIYNPYFSKTLGVTGKGWTIDGLSVPPYQLRGATPVQNLIPYFAVDKVVGQGYYVYGVVGEPMHYSRNAVMPILSYYVFDLEPNTKYYFNEVQWWGAVDENGICVVGGGASGTNPASEFNTASYPNAKRIYITTETDTPYFSKTQGGTVQGWTLEGLLAEKNNQVFATPSFSFPVNTEFRFYTKNACLRNPFYSAIDKSSSDSQYSDGYGLKRTSATNKTYTLATYNDNLESLGQASFSVNFKAKNARNLTALFIGDSTVAHSYMTQAVLDTFAANNVTCTLLGQYGTGSNKYEGIVGWTANECWGSATHGTYTNNLYNSTAGHFDFGAYLTKYSYSTPDFVFLQFGINDLFSVSPFNFETGYNTYKLALLNIINNIHTYNSNIKIVVNTIPMPNENASAFNALYGTSYYSWERRAVDIMANNLLVSDMPNYVIINPHHLILDSATQIRDDVHPTDAGYEVLGIMDANVMFVN